MKKTNLVLASLLALVSLAGCTDAEAKISDSSTVMFKVGSETVTKGDVYSSMKSAIGASVTINMATRIISSQEIEITEEMQTTAESTLESYKSLYGDTFAAYLETYGMTEEEYVSDYLIPSLQSNQFTEKYIEEDLENLIATYSPIKATVLEFSSQEDADAALSALNDGSKTPAEAASENNSDSTGVSTVYTLESTSIDSTVRTVLINSTSDDGWYIVPASDGATYCVVRIDEDDREAYRDDLISALETIDDVDSAATTYFFTKYGFHIYDKTIYDVVASDYPDQFVQED